MAYYSAFYRGVKVVKNGTAGATFTGSARFISNSANDLYDRPKKPHSHHKRNTINIVSNHKYRLNAPKIRKKIDAFFQLKATQGFCAFYSISFPCGMTDDHIFQCWNIWLTRCRAEQGLHSYIWVSERQKNGTLHYHLLTNTKMNIRSVNAFMGKTLTLYSHIYAYRSDIDNVYNGVDVDNIWFPKHRKHGKTFEKRTRAQAEVHVSKYVSKYVSKNKEEFPHLAWHCSRDISSLFTAQNFDEDECTPLLSYFQSTIKDWHLFPGEYVDTYVHPSFLNLNNFLELRQINNLVWERMNPPPV